MGRLSIAIPRALHPFRPDRDRAGRHARKRSVPLILDPILRGLSEEADTEGRHPQDRESNQDNHPHIFFFHGSDSLLSLFQK
jgi:hypothetical protein